MYICLKKWVMIMFFVITSANVLCASEQPSIFNITKEEIKPHHVLSYIDLIQQEIEYIRLEMGKPKSQGLPIKIYDAAPREVLFQAITLFTKTERLAFEQTRTKQDLNVNIQVHKIHLADVFEILKKTMERVSAIKQNLLISEKCTIRPFPANSTPSEVYMSILQTSRSLNLMLDKRFSPDNVFQEVTRAILYNSRILSYFPDINIRIPEPPPFIRRKQPADVYNILLDCYNILHNIADMSNIKMLKIEYIDTKNNDKSPSEVYDMASLIVSELSYIDSLLNKDASIIKAYYPGRKFPSHVYQRAGLLKKQLILLKEKVKHKPEWLVDSINE